MSSPSKESQLSICTSCGKPQTWPGHLCAHCGAPLTPFAHSDPVLGIQSRGFAAHQATHEPRKLIVVIGMWLWMLPLLILGLMMLCGSIAGFVYGEIIAALLMFGMGAGATWLSGTILMRTTRSYIRGAKARQKTLVAGPSDDEDAEPVECLDCGKMFSASAERCPACGWSYSTEN